MKSRFPLVELQGVPLVLDASAVINLLGTGLAPRLLRNLGMRVLVTAEAYGEIRRHPIPGEPIGPAMAALAAEQLIEQVQLGDTGRATFLDLVANDLNAGLDDGEASAIAAALEQSKDAVLVVDEKKAARLFAARWPARCCVPTVALLAQPRIRAGMSDEAFADAVFSALLHARMRVPADALNWILTLIGHGRAAQCPSLGLQR